MQDTNGARNCASIADFTSTVKVEHEHDCNDSETVSYITL